MSLNLASIRNLDMVMGNKGWVSETLKNEIERYRCVTTLIQMNIYFSIWIPLYRLNEGCGSWECEQHD